MLTAAEFAVRHPAEGPPRSFTTIETSHFSIDSPSPIIQRRAEITYKSNTNLSYMWSYEFSWYLVRWILWPRRLNDLRPDRDGKDALHDPWRERKGSSALNAVPVARRFRPLPRSHYPFFALPAAVPAPELSRESV